VVEGDRRKDMQNMYSLLKPLPKGLSVLAEIFEKHVRKVGLEAIENLKQETAPVDFGNRI
jgi:cullin 2